MLDQYAGSRRIFVAAFAAQGDGHFAPGELRNQIIGPGRAVGKGFIEQRGHPVEGFLEIGHGRRHLQMHGVQVPGGAACRIRLGACARVESQGERARRIQIKAVSAESMPPLRKTPTGTSDKVCAGTTSRSKPSSSCRASSALRRTTVAGGCQ